jgi:hypothetical protein
MVRVPPHPPQVVAGKAVLATRHFMQAGGGLRGRLQRDKTPPVSRRTPSLLPEGGDKGGSSGGLAIVREGGGGVGEEDYGVDLQEKYLGWVCFRGFAQVSVRFQFRAGLGFGVVLRLVCCGIYWNCCTFGLFFVCFCVPFALLLLYVCCTIGLLSLLQCFGSAFVSLLLNFCLTFA